MKEYFANNVCLKTVALLLMMPLVFLATGCHRDKVQVYQVPANQDQPVQPATPAPDTNSTALPPGHPDISSDQMPSGIAASDVQNAPSLAWTTPHGWTEVPPSEMRVASFKVAGASGKQADVSIVPLGGMGGGDSANVNRWRGQVGLQAAPDDELQKSAEDVEAGGQPAQLYDMAGQNSTGESIRIIAAIQHRDGTSWFFKMTGDADLVEQQKATFISFLKSLSFASQQDQAQLPPGHPDVSGMSVPSQTTESASPEGQPNWQAPAGWQSVSAGQFLVAKFMINGDNGTTADVNVSTSAGDGGGLAANVNRWRGQLGLPPVEEIATMTFAVPGGQAQLVDINGTNSQSGQAAEIVGIVVMQPGQTWFYKLMGDPKVVAAQKDVFTQFVRGVKY